MDWEKAPSGQAEWKPLYISPTDRVETRLVRFPPESGTEGAPALLGREVLVIEGEFEADGEELREEDFHRSVGASVTGQTSSGCTLFTIRENGADAGTGEAPDVGSLDEPMTIHANEGEWEDLAAGVREKSLFQDEEHHVRMGIVHLEPNTSLPAERGKGAEEVFVLRGTIRLQDQHLRAGDHARVEHEGLKGGERQADGDGEGGTGAEVAHTVGGCELVRIVREERGAAV